ncbi:PAC2 family protein [Streptosporangium vulgare]|uniref:PAC2 family protein n=1 Tax=Streptosporangium vulgare TaxID=46190 RepID=UPI0031DDA12C
MLLYHFDGFVDAGGAGRLAIAHLLDELEHRVVATFVLSTVCWTTAPGGPP